MGFLEVIVNLKSILKNIKFCKKDIVNNDPDALVLIDFPGFNMRIAKFIRSHTGIPVFYFIAPQVWAWKESRVKKLKNTLISYLSSFPLKRTILKNRV